MRSVLVLLAMSLLAAPMAGAGHPHVECVQTEEVHSYVGSIGMIVGVSIDGFLHDSTGPYGAGAHDSCVGIGADGLPRYDGETEMGVGGGRFVAGTSTCLQPEEVAHHAYGPGAEYWAEEATFTDLAYLAVADGPAFDPSDPCATDGVVTNDPFADPFDCAAGAMGVYADVWTPATLAENVPGSGACDPHDGEVWLFLFSFVVVHQDVGGIIASMPIQGHVWSGDRS